MQDPVTDQIGPNSRGGKCRPENWRTHSGWNFMDWDVGNACRTGRIRISRTFVAVQTVGRKSLWVSDWYQI